MKRPSVIILTAKYGSGHTQVAKVMADELTRSGYSIVISDLLGESYPTISHMTQNLLLKSFTYGQTFYKWFYYGTNKMNPRGLLQFSQYLGRKRLLQLIQQYRPSFILTTFPLHVAPYLLKRVNFSIPVYTIITDYCAHPYWINPLIDHYFVGSEHVKKSIMTLGIDKNKITVSGIPIRREFEKTFDYSSLYKKHTLSPTKPVITIIAGAHGLLKGVKEMCTQFLQFPFYQVVVVCGRNEELYRKLQSLAWAYPYRFRLYAFIEDIYELCSISSCIVTKPGGVTLTEACCLKVPLILYRPVPGQEKENAYYFVKNGAAYVTHTIPETINATQQLLNRPSQINQMKAGLEKLYYSQASSFITQMILNFHRHEKILIGGAK